MRAVVGGMLALSATVTVADSALAQGTQSGYGDSLSRTIGRDHPAIYSPSSPIYGGFDHQPTESELRASGEKDVSGKQAREVDELYNQLLSTGPGAPPPRRRHHAKAP